ncbi:type III toxin-antitoxin system ToxN/AbiQ family toxin, partial [Lactobacillus mulieris]|uniref:type III toxin-antitoxin system ToxN/AbiQ family toxin n=1 Tax=Lactobacillus mulieris TaxID=2508708 RepID=UPI0022441F26
TPFSNVLRNKFKELFILTQTILQSQKYRYLLYNQWRIINKYEDKIIHNSHILYRLITTEKEKHINLQKLCPDFLRLEEFCKGF